jgi:hypothetical protein
MKPKKEIERLRGVIVDMRNSMFEQRANMIKFEGGFSDTSEEIRVLKEKWDNATRRIIFGED